MTRRIFLSVVALGCFLSQGGYTQTNDVPAIPERTVFLSVHGHTYHRRKNCLALSHSSIVLTTTEAQAKARGLKRCGICWRTTKPKPQGNDAWAKPVEER